MLIELGKLMEEVLANGMKPISDIGELLSRTPFRAAWRREPGGLSNLLREVPNVEICENPAGGMSARLIVAPEPDKEALKNCYVDGSYIDAGHGFGGFGGWAALLPGGKLISGGRSGCKTCDVEVEAILFALEHTTGNLCIHSDSVTSIERLKNPLVLWVQNSLYLEFQPFLERYHALRRGRKIILTYTKSDDSWQHRTVHLAANREARTRYRNWTVTKRSAGKGKAHAAQ